MYIYYFERGISMDLINTYEEYKNTNEEYALFINGLVDSDLSNKDEVIANKLTEYQNKFEYLKVKCDRINVEADNVNNLKDLKYLIVDTLFLALDLSHFYTLGQVERFKMRAINYINKKRRAEFFN